MYSKDLGSDLIKGFIDVACDIAEGVHKKTGINYQENSICEYHRLDFLCNNLVYPDGHQYCYGMGFKFYKKDVRKLRTFNIRVYLIDKDTYLVIGTGVREPEVFIGSTSDLIDRLSNGLNFVVATVFNGETDLEETVKKRGRKKATANNSAIDLEDIELLNATDIELEDDFIRGNGKSYVKRNYGNFWYLLNRISGNPLRIDIKLWYCDSEHIKCPAISKEPIENKMFISKVYEHIIKAYSLSGLSVELLDENNLTLSNGASIELNRAENSSVIRDLKRFFIKRFDTIHIGNDIAKYIDYYYYLRSSNGRSLLKYFKYLFGRLTEIDANNKVKLLECDTSKLSKNSVTWVFRAYLNRGGKDITEIIKVKTINNIIMTSFGSSEYRDAYVAIDDFYSSCMESDGCSECSDFPDNLRFIINEFKGKFIGDITSSRFIKIKNWSGFEYLAILSIGNKHIHLGCNDNYGFFKIGYLEGSNKITEYQISKRKEQDKLVLEVEKTIGRIYSLVSRDALKLG